MASQTLGQLLALLAASGFALSVVFLAKSKRGRGDGGVLFSVLVTFLFAGVLWLVTEAMRAPLTMNQQFWIGSFWFGLSGVFAMVLGRNLVFNSIRILGPIRASATKRLNPFFSVAFAALFLQEAIGGRTALGLTVIALGIGLMIYQTFCTGPDTAFEPVRLSGYAWGIAAAAAYAGAYVARKLGLALLPSPAFGTLVSASVAIVVALLTAMIAPSRVRLRNAFTDLDRWTFYGAIAMSVAQIMLFSALLYERISVVVMISSLEVFIATFFSVLIFRSERRPPPLLMLAGCISTLGVVLVALD